MGTLVAYLPPYPLYRCPDCRHAEHPGRSCNRAGGVPCECGAYEWVDISDWQKKPDEEQQSTSVVDVEAPTAEPIQIPIPTPKRSRRSLIIASLVVMALLFFLAVAVLIYFSEVGFSSSQNIMGEDS